ncbi:hypothetical protein CARUB_v10001945mg [Capsella rubella]|uniref:DUF1985 domain-containing protein n=1 Tax=Capsella rubella TaxID=81985 RepID=R0HCY9_9BRAS|nr:hypothetical protein CARUB_v10001945mg [Capsella rubella]
MWALIEGSPIRFFLYEYEHISGLNCNPIDVEDQVDVDHTEFWEELQVDVGVGPNWYDLNVALKNCRTWDASKRKMIGLLFVMHFGMLGISRSSRITLEYAKKVLDIHVFQRFPWGRIGFKELMQSIKVVSFAQDGYAIHGCVHVVMIWALDSLTNLGKKYGNKRKNEDDVKAKEDVPLLCWGGSRPRIGLAETLASEKKLKKKACSVLTFDIVAS